MQVDPRGIPEDIIAHFLRKTNKKYENTQRTIRISEREDFLDMSEITKCLHLFPENRLDFMKKILIICSNAVFAKEENGF